MKTLRNNTTIRALALISTILILTISIQGCILDPILEPVPEEGGNAGNGHQSNDDRPDPPDCERYQTGTITIVNTSRTATYTIVLDGCSIGTIAPGQTLRRTVAAGTHMLWAWFAGTDECACYERSLQVEPCDHLFLSCDTERH